MCAQVSLIRTVFCTTSEQCEMIHLQMLIHWAENTKSYISAKYLSSWFLGMQADLRKIVEASLQCQEKFASCNPCLLIPQSNNIPNPVGGERLMSVCPFSSFFFFWGTCSMITACRSLFFKEYEKKMKGSILLSHPLHAHTGQPVTGRESIFWVSVWESDTCKQILLSLITSRASVSGEMCWSQANQLPKWMEKWEGCYGSDCTPRSAKPESAGKFTNLY